MQQMTENEVWSLVTNLQGVLDVRGIATKDADSLTRNLLKILRNKAVSFGRLKEKEM